MVWPGRGITGICLKNVLSGLCAHHPRRGEGKAKGFAGRRAAPGKRRGSIGRPFRALWRWRRDGRRTESKNARGRAQSWRWRPLATTVQPIPPERGSNRLSDAVLRAVPCEWGSFTRWQAVAVARLPRLALWSAGCGAASHQDANHALLGSPWLRWVPNGPLLPNRQPERQRLREPLEEQIDFRVWSPPYHRSEEVH